MHPIVAAVGISDGLLIALWGGLAALALGGYAYTWIVQGWVKGAEDRAMARIGAVAGDTQRAHSDLAYDMQKVQSQHALEDARLYATKVDLDEFKTLMRDMNQKLDRILIERRLNQ